MPLFMLQYAAKNSWAEAMSAVWLEHEYLAEELIILLTDREFCCFRQAQDASAATSVGQASQVCDH